VNTLIHNPGGNHDEHGKPLKITELYAYVAVASDGAEGIAGFLTTNGSMPMVASDVRSRDMLRPVALQVARVMRQRIRLLHFKLVESEEAEIIDP
jgi:hypothetical protein